jgi:hypothetical protein
VKVHSDAWVAVGQTLQIEENEMFNFSGIMGGPQSNNSGFMSKYDHLIHSAQNFLF